MRNVIDESGILAISTRLQRVAEQLRKDGQQIYKAHGIDFEPKWFPVVFSLHKKGTMSVTEIAQEIGYTHPSTISLLKELEKQKLIRSKKDKQDERKRLLLLTDKGQELVAGMVPIWHRMEQALAALTATEHNLMLAIGEVEAAMATKSFFEREQQLP
ncbi:MarR family winged helix-turn-helix transcriptional regulator [Chitinophaga sp. Cy-1792]|uniref:MarR family winged helix-turn-helix transcriptional regulator n=1 Tax=Chitinophaga sp. Cy-1792 TaxID=2608339 RepID=UPI001421B3E2|nr:MarR family transcriptional regulator [Chitinophaga sp. Cy-1792]NIG54394.1 MarR family transcriptional regulator [Chitinophaga sp. Cy-1792]